MGESRSFAQRDNFIVRVLGTSSSPSIASLPRLLNKVFSVAHGLFQQSNLTNRVVIQQGMLWVYRSLPHFQYVNSHQTYGQGQEIAKSSGGGKLEGDNNRNPNPSSYANYNHSGYPSYSSYGAGGGFNVGGSAAPAPYGGGFSSQPAVASGFKPPPSPPRSSVWDFLNPFEGFDKFYPAATSSRDSRDVREEEGIPDLEDEDDVVMKEVHGHHSLLTAEETVTQSHGWYPKQMRRKQMAHSTGQGRKWNWRQFRLNMRCIWWIRRWLILMTGQKIRVVLLDSSLVVSSKEIWKVVREIQLQFDHASESGSELSKFLEVGKLLS